MGKVVDAEIIVKALSDHAKANLATIIGNINTEKNDGFLMKAPIAGAYLEISLNDKVMNFDPFVFTYIESVTSQVRGPNLSKEWRIGQVIFVAQKAIQLSKGEEYFNLRYQRAMEELGQSAWRTALRGYEFDVEALNPVDVQLQNTTNWHRVFGIELSLTLSN